MVNMSGILVTKKQNTGISSMTINRSVKGLGQTMLLFLIVYGCPEGLASAPETFVLLMVSSAG